MHEYTVCWKCKRSIRPLERREYDKRSKKTWLITYCPFERCAVNLDITPYFPMKLWDNGYFRPEADPDEP